MHQPIHRRVAEDAKGLAFSFVVERPTNENQHASGSRTWKQKSPKGLGLIPFRPSQRKGIKEVHPQRTLRLFADPVFSGE